MSNSILRLPRVIAESGYPRSSLYLRISQGLWPQPIKIGARSVGWPAAEVELINSARIAGHTDTQIKKLVNTIHANRRNSHKGGDSHV